MLNLERDEPGIVVPTRSFGSPTGKGRAIVIVAELGKDDSGLASDIIEPIVGAG